MVETVLEQAPFSGHVFVFRGKRGDRPSWCTFLQKPGSLRVLFW